MLHRVAHRLVSHRQNQHITSKNARRVQPQNQDYSITKRARVSSCSHKPLDLKSTTAIAFAFTHTQHTQHTVYMRMCMREKRSYVCSLWLCKASHAAIQLPRAHEPLHFNRTRARYAGIMKLNAQMRARARLRCARRSHRKCARSLKRVSARAWCTRIITQCEAEVWAMRSVVETGTIVERIPGIV